MYKYRVSFQHKDEEELTLEITIYFNESISDLTAASRASRELEKFVLNARDWDAKAVYTSWSD